MKIYVIRHGETELNKKHVLQGTSDSPLTERGIEGAKKIKEVLESIDFFQVIASPLRRSIRTAEIIIGKDREISINPLVSEMSFGSWQGKTQDEICKTDLITVNYVNYFKHPEKYVAQEGAESFEDVLVRSATFLEDMIQLEKERPKGNVLLVTHGAFIKALLTRINGKSISEFWQEPYITNCSITLIELNKGQISILKEVDVNHLGEHQVKMSASGYLK